MLRNDNPMNRAILLALLFEIVVFVLAIPGMIQIENVPVWQAVAAGGGAAVIPLLAAATLRHLFGWVLAWTTQLAAVALGLLTPWMYFVGGVFAALFVGSFVLGRRIEGAVPDQ